MRAGLHLHTSRSGGLPSPRAPLAVCAVALLAGLCAPSAALAQAAPEAKAAAKALRVAVYDFELSGVDERIGQLVTASVLVELRKLERVSVIGMQEIRQMLDVEAERQLAGCDDAESCLADVAGALGADVVVTGSLARVGDEHIFGMRRIEQAEARVGGSVSRRLVAEDGEEFLAAVGPVVAELFPDHALRAGQERGVADEVALRLNPPPLPTWVAYGVGAGSAMLGLGSLLSLGLHAVLRGQFLGRVEEAERLPGQWSSAKQTGEAANALAATSWVLLGGALLGGVAVAALAPFVDWRGYGDAAIE